ncbi:MAG: DegT/DnrJ/EryC1/StrS family aminotransferase [Phycisphaeraceae bacterium]
MTSTRTQTTNELAINGGPKAFEGRTGKAEPKIGIEEFLSIAERFGFNETAMQRLRGAVSNDDLPEGGPNLARFISTHPKPSKGEVYEAAAREFFGVKYARPASSGTGALHAAMVGVGVGPGKEVIVPAVGFIATAMAVVLAGGRPVFCDIDESMTIDPEKIAPLITERTVAVAPTHWAGHVCGMDRIMAVAREHKIAVIEDCAQAPGASYKDNLVGTIGDVGCFSISAYKIIGGSEGGMFISNDERIFERASQLAEAGGLWRPDRFAPSRYDGELFAGANYRLSELESAVDLVQLRKLPGIVQRFRTNCRRVVSQVEPCGHVRSRRSHDPEGDIGYEWRFIPESMELGARIVEALQAEGIGAGMRGRSDRPDWHYYAQMLPLVETKTAERAKHGDCPVADDLFARTVRISIDQWWSEADCDRVAAGINKVFAGI